MDDYLTRVAEAVRDAVLDETVIVEMPALRTVCRDRIDLPAVIASVPRPEPVAWRHSHTHSLHDLAADVELADGDEWAEPLYAEPVAAQPAVPGEIDCSDAPYMPADMEPDLAYRDGWNACRDAMLAAAPEAPQPAAARDVLAERQRQVSAEGWTPEHDDVHSHGELAQAAACYAINAHQQERLKQLMGPAGWPWDYSWWKPGLPRRDLVKAGALILAEIERLDRARGAQS
ncbi:hypothetical protein [Microvirgula aerodenitrificans]|uniref:hypothetical protein n=1 Tax=Microvirgula aerodenitrificans TaxID=57480 RepID=UPI0009FE5416|nr:hypothetical protein [Microvirgula aerodenitrificans]